MFNTSYVWDNKTLYCSISHREPPLMGLFRLHLSPYPPRICIYMLSLIRLSPFCSILGPTFSLFLIPFSSVIIMWWTTRGYLLLWWWHEETPGKSLSILQAYSPPCPGLTSVTNLLFFPRIKYLTHTFALKCLEITRSLFLVSWVLTLSQMFLTMIERSIICHLVNLPMLPSISWLIDNCAISKLCA